MGCQIYGIGKEIRHMNIMGSEKEENEQLDNIIEEEKIEVSSADTVKLCLLCHECNVNNDKNYPPASQVASRKP